jgi:hypothetical protein
MLAFDPNKCLVEVRQAETEDLLDRVTAYRRGMDPQAIGIIEQELTRRSILAAKIHAHAKECSKHCLFDRKGVALSCSQCRRPAVTESHGWHRLFGLVPLFPKRVRYCKTHRPT